MAEESARQKWSFGVQWILLNTLGWGIILVAAFAAGWLEWQIYQSLGYSTWSRLLQHEEVRIYIATIIFGIVGGVIIGSVQQLLLRRIIRINGMYWVLSTMVGITLYMIVITGLYPSYISLHYQDLLTIKFAIYAACGLVFGISQWLVLRQNYVRSGWWIVATTLSLPLSAIITSVLYNQLQLNVPTNLSINIFITIIVLFIEGFCYGVATWLVTINIARKPNLSIDEHNQVQPVQ